MTKKKQYRQVGGKRVSTSYGKRVNKARGEYIHLYNEAKKRGYGEAFEKNHIKPSTAGKTPQQIRDDINALRRLMRENAVVGGDVVNVKRVKDFKRNTMDLLRRNAEAGDLSADTNAKAIALASSLYKLSFDQYESFFQFTRRNGYSDLFHEFYLTSDGFRPRSSIFTDQDPEEMAERAIQVLYDQFQQWVAYMAGQTMKAFEGPAEEFRRRMDFDNPKFAADPILQRELKRGVEKTIDKEQNFISAVVRQMQSRGDVAGIQQLEKYLKGEGSAPDSYLNARRTRAEQEDMRQYKTGELLFQNYLQEIADAGGEKEWLRKLKIAADALKKVK